MPRSRLRHLLTILQRTDLASAPLVFQRMRHSLVIKTAILF
jgi:hypothetical protein